MSFDHHVFCRPKCDFPVCETQWQGVEYDWFYSESEAVEEVADSEDWVCLFGDDGRPRFFCPLHTAGGWFEDDDPECQPNNKALYPYYADVSTSQPLPAPEDESAILSVLHGKY